MTFIDYGLLGHAFDRYVAKGYTPVEVPWLVGIEHIKATAPASCKSFELAHRQTYDKLVRVNGPNHFVGSAEQSFLSLDLPAGRYVGVTPCFRDEYRYDKWHQQYFMKIELFVRTENPILEVLTVMRDAEDVMGPLTTEILNGQATDEGYDLMLNGIEVGSYGSRSHPDFGSWVYGTGLALPRFTSARDILSSS